MGSPLMIPVASATHARFFETCDNNNAGADELVNAALAALDEKIADRDGWAVHQPAAPDAPIPGRHWYAGCTPDRPRVHPVTGVCEDCGGVACPECGREDCPDCQTEVQS